MTEIILDNNHYLELEKLAIGAFAPLGGFMGEEEFWSVIHEMRLTDGSLFPIPVLLDVTADHAKSLMKCSSVPLIFQNQEVGELKPESSYSCDKQEISIPIFGTDDINHPGVAAFCATKRMFIGGPVKLTNRIDLDISRWDLTPAQTKKLFRKNGWKTVACFHTRNAPHRAHEMLHRLALEICDGLFVQPLLGQKRPGDFTPEAIIASYEVLISEFYPAGRVALGALSTFGRYAGPREALFHAIVRRNFGCTHFIVGRDHAGIGQYYGLYESQELCLRHEEDLRIKIIAPHEPYHCGICGTVVTDRTCRHQITDPRQVRRISGVDIRTMLKNGIQPPPELIRPEILASLDGIPLFIDADN